MVQSLRALVIVVGVASVAAAGYFISRWVGAQHEQAMIFPALSVTLLAHLAHRLDENKSR